jgi:hypothetical protein
MTAIIACTPKNFYQCGIIRSTMTHPAMTEPVPITDIADQPTSVSTASDALSNMPGQLV